MYEIKHISLPTSCLKLFIFFPSLFPLQNPRNTDQNITPRAQHTLFNWCWPQIKGCSAWSFNMGIIYSETTGPPQKHLFHSTDKNCMDTCLLKSTLSEAPQIAWFPRFPSLRCPLFIYVRQRWNWLISTSDSSSLSMFHCYFELFTTFT